MDINGSWIINCNTQCACYRQQSHEKSKINNIFIWQKSSLQPSLKYFALVWRTAELPVGRTHKTIHPVVYIQSNPHKPSCCCKYSVENQMCIKPQMKTVPDQCCLNKNKWKKKTALLLVFMSFTLANVWIFLMIVCADTVQYSEDPLALNPTEKYLLREISLIGGIPRDKWHALNHFTAPGLPRQFHWLSQPSSLQHREWDINIYTMWSVKAKDIKDQIWY